jgi:hypothetical protein
MFQITITASFNENSAEHSYWSLFLSEKKNNWKYLKLKCNKIHYKNIEKAFWVWFYVNGKFNLVKFAKNKKKNNLSWCDKSGGTHKNTVPHSCSVTIKRFPRSHFFLTDKRKRFISIYIYKYKRLNRTPKFWKFQETEKKFNQCFKSFNRILRWTVLIRLMKDMKNVFPNSCGTIIRNRKQFSSFLWPFQTKYNSLWIQIKNNVIFHFFLRKRECSIEKGMNFWCVCLLWKCDIGNRGYFMSNQPQFYLRWFERFPKQNLIENTSWCTNQRISVFVKKKLQTIPK